MDFNKLKTFVTVTELGSVTSAARYLRRSQPAISQQVRLLEEELELKLFERKSGRIHLSRDGERLFEIAKAKLSDIQSEVSLLKDSKAALEGVIRLGVIGDDTNAFSIGEALASFLKANPRATFEIRYGTNAEVERALLSKEVDIGILVYFTQKKMFVRHPVDQGLHRVYASKSYLASHGPLRGYRDVIDAHLVDLTPELVCFRTWIKKNSPTLLGSLSHRSPDISVSNHRAILDIVRNGFGLGLIPVHLIESTPGAAKQLELVVSTAKPVTTGLDLAYRTNHALSRLEQAFVDQVLKA